MRKRLQHILLWIVALSILNSSIDVIDAPQLHAGAVATENRYLEIESILELVLDTTLDQSLPDDTGSDQHLLKQAGSFVFSTHQPKEKLVAPPPEHSADPLFITLVSGAPQQGFISFFSPPPDASHL